MSNKIPILPKQQQPGQQIKVSLDDLECVQCEHCQGETFDVVWKIHKVPAVLSQTGKESLFPVALFRCVTCFKTTKIIHRG